jgi:hypothetical protein
MLDLTDFYSLFVPRKNAALAFFATTVLFSVSSNAYAVQTMYCGWADMVLKMELDENSKTVTVNSGTNVPTPGTYNYNKGGNAADEAIDKEVLKELATEELARREALREQIETLSQALKNADKVGDVEAARKIAAEIRVAIGTQAGPYPEELTLEQKRAIAKANARLRLQLQGDSAPEGNSIIEYQFMISDADYDYIFRLQKFPDPNGFFQLYNTRINKSDNKVFRERSYCFSE